MMAWWLNEGQDKIVTIFDPHNKLIYIRLNDKELNPLPITSDADVIYSYIIKCKEIAQRKSKIEKITDRVKKQ